MNPSNDPSATPKGQEPEKANSQPAIAGGEPVRWWLNPMDLNDRAQARAAAGQPALDWEHSINDLLTLTGNDHRVQSRLWLARVLGWPDPQPSDHSVVSPEMNAWLCKRLKEELVKFGSTLPKPRA